MIKLLCIDGGGMRGLLPTMVVAEFERRTGKPANEHFDLIAGTSIGGIVAALLSAGIPATDALGFFTEDGPNIFHRSLWHRLGLFVPKYSADPLEAVLKKRFGTLSNKDCKIPLLIPTLDVVSEDPYFFKSYSGEDFLLWQAARATSAAQTYFPAYQFGEHILWDGGNVANNPSDCALAEAWNLFGDTSIKVLSLGCGEKMANPHPQRLLNPGFVVAGIATVNLLFEASSAATDYRMREATGEHYHRFNPPLSTPIGLDDADPESIATLKVQGQQAVRDAQETLTEYLQDVAS